jgi:hypothetical protein
MKKNPGSKEKLKQLRKERSAWIDHAKTQIKTSNQLIKKIKPQIKDRALTIPQIASAVDEPPSTILIYVSALKKFGMVQEAGKDGDYYTYQLSS